MDSLAAYQPLHFDTIEIAVCGDVADIVPTRKQKGISDIYFVVLVEKTRKAESEARVEAEGLVDLVHSYSGLRVFTNALFKEIRFPLEANRFHPLKRVRRYC